jgi:hypothetical protein
MTPARALRASKSWAASSCPIWKRRRLAEDSLEQTLARIAGTPVEKKPVVPSNGIFPEPLQKIVGGDEGAVKWRSLGTGAKQCVLHSEDGASARLLYIPAGQAMPEHGHRGMELTLVLKGAYRDETDRFGRGDVEFADEDMDHTPVAEAWRGLHLPCRHGPTAEVQGPPAAHRAALHRHLTPAAQFRHSGPASVARQPLAGDFDSILHPSAGRGIMSDAFLTRMAETLDMIRADGLWKTERPITRRRAGTSPSRRTGATC